MDRLGGAFGAHDAQDHLDDDFVDEADADLDPPPSPVGQDERRMQVRAYNHWASLLGDAAFPNIEDLEPELLDDFGPYSVLLDFSTGIENPAVRFVGGELRKECDVEGPLEHLDDVPPRSLLSRITDHYMQILANQAPIGFEAEFVNQRGSTVLYRGILLPYSSDDETIDFIFGVINWKELADAKTADELLLQIDQALAGETVEFEAVEEGDDMLELTQPLEDLSAEASDDWDDEEDEDGTVLDLGSDAVIEDDEEHEIPAPAFGQVEDDVAASVPARRERGVDALGNPLGSLAAESHDDDGAGEDDFDTGIKTAADYGLPDWDEEEYEDDDVDDLVDPLADDDAGSSLMSLVSRGDRQKKTVDLSALASPAAPAIPQAYEPEEPVEDYSNYGAYEADEEYEDFEDAEEASEVAAADVEAADEPAAEPVVAEELAPIVAEAVEDAEIIASAEEQAPEGLYDCLVAARELAQVAQNTEDRSRKALYAAVGLAYDFSLEAQDAPEDFQEIIADNGLTMQDRAPMTPVVKLVFGADYDKTRLTEYAAVLTHAHRVGVERGKLVDYLRAAEGGLKGVVQAERRARKEEQGKPVEDDGTGIRPALAKKLRKLETAELSDVALDGPEFALVMVRRTEDGELVVVGELAEDRVLLEKAARKLLAK
uniref:PAS domain-containing protein n=1 Tax=Qipengyuania gaetbuli TaxID=266952 RepID=UPI00389A2B96